MINNHVRTELLYVYLHIPRHQQYITQNTYEVNAWMYIYITEKLTIKITYPCIDLR